ncbi:MAG: hypothetical protein AAF251_03655 [Pseudomonadota bacterium]
MRGAYAVGTKKTRVLVVEDNVPLACTWSEELERRHYKVRHSIDVCGGLELCKDQWPDAIILDAFFRDCCEAMVEASGSTFCAKLAELIQNSGHSAPLVIGVSGAVANEGQSSGAFCGVPASLMPIRVQKPVSGSDLADRLDEAKRRGQLKDPQQLGFVF